MGIKLQSETGQDLLFAGLANHSAPEAEQAGWYPALQHAQKIGASQHPGHSVYQRRFTAILHRLPGRAVTTGRVQATAYVVVKVQ